MPTKAKQSKNVNKAYTEMAWMVDSASHLVVRPLGSNKTSRPIDLGLLTNMGYTSTGNTRCDDNVCGSLKLSCGKHTYQLFQENAAVKDTIFKGYTPLSGMLDFVSSAMKGDSIAKQSGTFKIFET
jgi:hypothetical protein